MQVAYKAAVQGRQFGTTERGDMGLFPRETRVGDLVCVFKLEGGHIPLVLKRCEKGTGYRLLIGLPGCYQHGVMNDQIISEAGFKFYEIEFA